MAERTSATHGPRLDEALAAEAASLTKGAPVEAHADEARLMEALDDESVGGAGVSPDRVPRPPTALPADEVEARSVLATSLRMGQMPAARDELVAMATDEHAPEWVIEALGRLDPDQTFATVQEIWDALGGHHESRAEMARIANPETTRVSDDAASATDRVIETPPVRSDEGSRIEPSQLEGSGLSSDRIVRDAVVFGVGVFVYGLRGAVRAGSGVLHLVRRVRPW